MSGYRLLSYQGPSGPHPGLLVEGMVYSATEVLRDFGLEAPSLLAILEQWDKCERALAESAHKAPSRAGVALADASLLTPVLYPNAIYCAAANYRDHMRAMAAKLGQDEEPDPRTLDVKPYHFVVPGRSGVAGPADPIRLPRHGSKIDWEIELVVVIGKAAKDVSPVHALDHVAAYCIGNDLSVRDARFIKIPNIHLESVFRNDFIGMKAFDQSCTVGPWLVPASSIADPQSLWLKLWIGDELMQDSNTSEMIYSVAEQISYLSARVTLLPGDLIMTGTPAGTGMERDRFLRPGDRITLAIEQLGEMTQTVSA